MSSLHSCNYLHDLYNNKEYPLYFILSFTKIRFIEIETTILSTDVFIFSVMENFTEKHSSVDNRVL